MLGGALLPPKSDRDRPGPVLKSWGVKGQLLGGNRSGQGSQQVQRGGQEEFPYLRPFHSDFMTLLLSFSVFISFLKNLLSFGGAVSWLLRSGFLQL